jgi:hypothetical protein
MCKYQGNSYLFLRYGGKPLGKVRSAGADGESARCESESGREAWRASAGARRKVRRAGARKKGRWASGQKVRGTGVFRSEKQEANLLNVIIICSFI